jgi:hypothetical protein
LGIGWIAALSPQAKGRIERSFLTAQDRLVKQLRLAKVSTMEAANAFLENEYWPEWNERFARPVKDFPNQHRTLSPSQDLAAILCHVEERVIANDYTFSFAAQRYQIARQQIQAGMRRQRLRLELRLDGELRARYQGRITAVAEPLVRKPRAGIGESDSGSEIAGRCADCARPRQRRAFVSEIRVAFRNCLLSARRVPCPWLSESARWMIP